jgi:hypothetical protein
MLQRTTQGGQRAVDAADGGHGPRPD